ncbi:RNB domain-containing ribonuclease [Chitiniphilus purpureus]|uniref:RNB domain-containing ribonuclease n=1 Tax=Chitiniphilus purpureus TaxID=2981137 RepID=A0ABY6DN40_9NEIS|nr:RNB domain-containing ribonuclease [Chitiniphilus sp. CD1]UXY15083.1 RNB domain-containing ribonuclease [Chitiniphilus sp. CD1]
MHVLYEEDGGFKVATIKEAQPASLMVEDVRGKRSKVKASNVLLRFERPDPTALWQEAETLAGEIDLDFLWEVCGADEFGFEEIAVEYYGAGAGALQQAAVLLRVASAPMYFYKKGRGRYKAAPEDNLKAALAGLARKQREAEQMAAWQAELMAGGLPEVFAPVLHKLLHRPDKNGLEWKALAAAAEATQTSPLRLLHKVGAIPDVGRYFLEGFLLQFFPNGREAQAEGDYPPPADLPLAQVAAFSIDDSTTTEIDDAFSIVPLKNGNTQVGIHIAAPTLGIAPGSPMDKLVFERLSTVYFPGDKITMLPDGLVAQYTLKEGGARPAISLYLELSPGFDVLSHQTRIEQVPIVANLRHDQIEPYFNEATAGHEHEGEDYPWKAELNYLWRFAGELEGRRGKAEPNAPVRLDYSFYVDTLPDGSQTVRIVPRRRGSPMDKLVSELAILVNSTWGKDLARGEVAAVYRSQGGGRVRLTTQPGPHLSLGVDCYAWSSSPLRRAIDFINQQQLLALLRNEKPRFGRNDAELYAAIGAFDTAYAAYAEFQDRMERYWCLRYLEQENRNEMSCTVIKENLVRVDGTPLVIRVPGLPELPAGATVKLLRLATDYLELNLDCRLATM